MDTYLRVSIVSLLFLVLPLHAEQLTTVRLGKPKGVFTSSYEIWLGDISVEARNVGSLQAEEIEVTVTLPNGVAKSLRGPSTLGPNKSAVYSGYGGITVTNNRSIQASVRCKNCR